MLSSVSSPTVLAGELLVVFYGCYDSGADYADPTTFLDCLRSDNGNNDSGYNNARYDALLDRARSTTDAARRANLLRDAERMIVEEDVPVVPILHYAEPIAIQPWVSGLHPNSRMWFPFRTIRVTR